VTLKNLCIIAMLIVITTLSGCASLSGQSTRLSTHDLDKVETIVTFGTSLTAGGAWVSQLDTALAEYAPGKFTVINSGAGGMWSNWGVENLEKRVIEKNPDLVFIEFAINDAFLKHETPVEMAQANLINMIDRIHVSNPDCIIILMVMNPPINEHLERRPKINDYYQMYREVARDQHLLLIDHYPDWEEILINDKPLFDRYVPDGIHPNTIGCTAITVPNILAALGVKSVPAS
jgi:acyl-CoA thioesterase-1